MILLRTMNSIYKSLETGQDDSTDPVGLACYLLYGRSFGPGQLPSLPRCVGVSLELILFSPPGLIPEENNVERGCLCGLQPVEFH